MGAQTGWKEKEEKDKKIKEIKMAIFPVFFPRANCFLITNTKSYIKLPLRLNPPLNRYVNSTSQVIRSILQLGSRNGWLTFLLWVINSRYYNPKLETTQSVYQKENE